MSTCLIYSLPYCAAPDTYFARIHSAPGAVLLDSGRPAAERGRYDLMSAWPLAELAPETGESAKAFLNRLRKSLAALPPAELTDVEAPFAGGLIGYLSYDFGRLLHPLHEAPSAASTLPLARFGLYPWALISDHQTLKSFLIFHPSLSAESQQQLIELFSHNEPSTAAPFALTQGFTPAIDALRYEHAISRIQQYILSGDCYQVNFTQRFSAPCSGDPFSAYQALRSACPTPFAGYIALGDDEAIVSLSPERFIKVNNNQVETRPIKGTRPRGATPSEDHAQAQQLLASEKDRAENLMIVDLLRNDLGRTCETGSVQVPELFSLESYPNVHHLVSAVTGTLAHGKDAFDLLADTFPGGSITGAPKIRAMQIIDELEANQRSIYCGSLLYIDVRGQMDSSIAIRTVLVKDGQAHCWGGGGVVTDSNWRSEYEESITKVKVLMQTLEQLSDIKKPA